MKHQALLAFGANLGNPRATFNNVITNLQTMPDLQVAATSRLIATQPVGGRPGQPAFLNGAIRIETTLSADELVRRLLQIEVKLGRTRDQRWDARTVDLDLLLLDRQTISDEHCQIPHPRMTFRQFMLVPAAEIAADWLHPYCGCSLGTLLRQLQQGIKQVALSSGATKSCDDLEYQKTDALKRICREHDVPLVELNPHRPQDSDGRLTVLFHPAVTMQPTTGPYLELCGPWSATDLKIEMEAAFLAAQPISDSR